MSPALDRIIANFGIKECPVLEFASCAIVGIEDIHETAVLPWAAQSIPRRFCSGTAVINDGVKHPIYYSIAEDTGMIGMDWGVNFCVAGLDRNMAYSRRAAPAKPQALKHAHPSARSAHTVPGIEWLVGQAFERGFVGFVVGFRLVADFVSGPAAVLMPAAALAGLARARSPS